MHSTSGLFSGDDLCTTQQCGVHLVVSNAAGVIVFAAVWVVSSMSCVAMPLFVAGDSAGAAIALAVAQLLRDQQDEALIDGLVLISPWLDATMSNPEHPKLQRRDRIQSIPGLRAFAGA